jgi:hypothetical protein
LNTPAPTAIIDSHPIEQGESAARESTIEVLGPDHATTPPLPLAVRGQTFSTHIDSAPSEILIGPLSRALPGTGPDEDFKPTSQETPDVSSYEKDSRPLFKFGEDEREPLAIPPLQADFAAHDPDIASSGRYELGDSDSEMFRSLQNPTVPRRRTLLLILGSMKRRG